MTELPAYSGPRTRCPKCRAAVEGATYQHAFPVADDNAAPVDAGVYHRQYERYATRVGGPGESMLRKCQTCGYQWAETCADSGDANPLRPVRDAEETDECPD